MTAVLTQRADGRLQISGRPGHWPTFIFKAGTTNAQAGLVARFLNTDLVKRPVSAANLRRLSYNATGQATWEYEVDMTTNSTGFQGRGNNQRLAKGRTGMVILTDRVAGTEATLFLNSTRVAQALAGSSANLEDLFDDIAHEAASHGRFGRHAWNDQRTWGSSPRALTLNDLLRDSTYLVEARENYRQGERTTYRNSAGVLVTIDPRVVSQTLYVRAYLTGELQTNLSGLTTPFLALSDSNVTERAKADLIDPRNGHGVNTSDAAGLLSSADKAALERAQAYLKPDGTIDYSVFNPVSLADLALSFGSSLGRAIGGDHLVIGVLGLFVTNMSKVTIVKMYVIQCFRFFEKLLAADFSHYSGFDGKRAV